MTRAVRSGVAARLAGLVLGLAIVLAPGARLPAQDRLPVESVKLPAGFQIAVFSADVPGARSMGLSPGGTLFVGTRGEGVVYAIANATRAARAERPVVIARRLGVRNSVGFDWHPGTKALWFTDNGRDRMGDDEPPDELNHAPRAGLHFGFPYCHGQAIADPEHGRKRPCSEFRPPAIDLGPHVAALGMRFYTGTMFPGEYHRQVFIAEHGSWNRSTPIGYGVSLVRLEGDRAVKYEVFAEGWLQDGRPWGRPVDVLVMPDGALLVSDDHAGAIYRISYQR